MSPPEVVFHPDADLRLEVHEGDQQVSFRVCSHVLAMASRVFKALLFGGFAESKIPAHGEWVVQLPDEEIAGLEVVMNILHLNFQKIPEPLRKRLSFLSSVEDQEVRDALSIICAVATTVDKYDLLHAVQPWATIWAHIAREFSRKSEDEHRWRGDLTWIAWVFGMENLLNTQLDLAVLSASLAKNAPDDGTNSDQSMTGGDASNLSNTPELHVFDDFHRQDIPPYRRSQSRSESLTRIVQFLGVAHKIGQRRLELIAYLLEPLRALLRQQVSDTCDLANNTGSELDGSFHGRGSGTFLLNAAEISFLQAENFTLSVVQLYKHLSDPAAASSNLTMVKRDFLLLQNIELNWEKIKKKGPLIQLSELQKEELRIRREKAGISLFSDDGGFESWVRTRNGTTMAMASRTQRKRAAS